MEQWFLWLGSENWDFFQTCKAYLHDFFMVQKHYYTLLKYSECTNYFLVQEYNLVSYFYSGNITRKVTMVVNVLQIVSVLISLILHVVFASHLSIDQPSCIVPAISFE